MSSLTYYFINPINSLKTKLVDTAIVLSIEPTRNQLMILYKNFVKIKDDFYKNPIKLK